MGSFYFVGSLPSISLNLSIECSFQHRRLQAWPKSAYVVDMARVSLMSRKSIRTVVAALPCAIASFPRGNEP